MDLVDIIEQEQQKIKSDYPQLSKHLSNQHERNIENIDNDPNMYANPYDSEDDLEGEEYSDLFNGEPLVNANVKQGHDRDRQSEDRTDFIWRCAA